MLIALIRVFFVIKKVNLFGTSIRINLGARRQHARRLDAVVGTRVALFGRALEFVGQCTRCLLLVQVSFLSYCLTQSVLDCFPLTRLLLLNHKLLN